MENDITTKIRSFEFKFNEKPVKDVKVILIEEDIDYYYADVIVVFENDEIEIAYGCKYPKKLINIFEE